MNIGDALAQTKAEMLRLDDEIAAAQAHLDEVTAKRQALQGDAAELESFLTYQTATQPPKPVPVTL